MCIKGPEFREVIRGLDEILGAGISVEVYSIAELEASISSDCDDIEVAYDELVLISDSRSE